jgi:phosphoribosylformylglycinamidine cyclo-ligase
MIFFAILPIIIVYPFLQRHGRVAEDEMYRPFNMGVGMVVVVASGDVEAVEAHLDRAGERHYRIGAIEAGDGRVRYA